ncbi:MAG TPA: hypothetical protein V6D07_00845 [Trichocoleus sp.]
MARYTNFFKVPRPSSSLRDSLVSSLKSCDLNMVYEAADYLVAKEKPGQVSLSQLATVEVLINPPTTESAEAKVNLVVKNEELALSANNHCHRIFEVVNEAIEAAAV